MTIGVGGSDPTAELQAMQSMRGDAHPISNTERETRIAKAQELMRQQGITALYLDASTSLYCYTGLRARGKERLHGAVIPADGPLSYICPAFEVEKTAASIVMPGEIRGWEEHEDPTALVIDTVEAHGAGGTLAVDESTPFFTFDGLRKAGNRFDFVNGSDITGACRMIKSETEIALMKRAKEITLEVQKAAVRILTPGITTEEVKAFIAEAHRKLGADGPTAFCIVLFGEATPRKREIWNLELAAQAAAFNAAQPGAPCEDVDAAARAVIEKGGLGPGYAVPGLPHRTGHGIGLDVHEWTYLVKENRTPLAPGMCFSNEPMICIYGEFGVRLEDHFYITEDGPVWFTQPCHSVDDPFGYEATP